MPKSPWQRRIQRAQDLIERHEFAGEILGFYVHLARFQEELQRDLERALPKQAITGSPEEIGHKELATLGSRFGPFLSVVEKHGPKLLAQLAHDLHAPGKNPWIDLLRDTWRVQSPSVAREFLVQAFLQPYAELQRSRVPLLRREVKYASCPFCHRRPGLGVLRQMGEGAARSMVCGFCASEWDFRRLVCPGCGEEDDKKLPVFTASEFDYIRVECCESCKTYLKTIDLTKNGRAEPLVDELASAPLDLWAREHGYAKLHPNLLGM
jgi:FdhE protein